VSTGRVKWFNNKKGYGFVVPDEGGQDIFVHFTEIKVDGRVTRTVKPEPDNASIIPGMGIEFLNLDLESEFIIQSLIE